MRYSLSLPLLIALSFHLSSLFSVTVVPKLPK
nr:MAG TPA: hypothetical protein [Bacteriophage sp.]